MSTSFRLTKTETENLFRVIAHCLMTSSLRKEQSQLICVMRILFLAHHVHLKSCCLVEHLFLSCAQGTATSLESEFNVLLLSVEIHYTIPFGVFTN